MTGVLYLSWRHLMHARAQSLILILCVGVTLLLPAAANVLIGRYEVDLRSRAASTPMVVGAVGNRFDLTLSTLYFRQGDLTTIPTSVADMIRESGLGVPIPMSVRFTAQGVGLVGVSAEYFSMRGLQPAEGTLPLMLGDVVLGSRAAERLGIETGGDLFSDQKDLYDIAKPAALKMNACGVLAPSGTPDDDVVFVDIKTVWVLEGLSHAHVDVTRRTQSSGEGEGIDEALVLSETDEHVVVSQALIEYNEITDETARSIHLHADPGSLPLTAILVQPTDEKAATLLKARLNAMKLYQAVIPSRVVDDLMAFVFRIKRLFDAITIVLAASTTLLIALVMLLSMRIRAREMQTLTRIGCGRFVVAQLYSAEVVTILILGVLLAVSGVGVLTLVLPNLTFLL